VYPDLCVWVFVFVCVCVLVCVFVLVGLRCLFFITVNFCQTLSNFVKSRKDLSNTVMLTRKRNS